MPRKTRHIPWLDTDKTGIYYAHWYDDASKRTQRMSMGTRSDIEAQDRFAAFLTEGRPIREPSRMAGISVSQALDDYTREHIIAKVIDETRQENAIRHLKKFFGDTPLRLVDIPACRLYGDARRRGDIGGGARKRTVELRRGSDATIRRELVVLGAAARHALRWRRILVTDMPSIELPEVMRRLSLGEEEWLTHEELDRILAAATGHLRDFILLAYESASRREAIETLTKPQVDLAGGRVFLQNPLTLGRKRQSKKRRPVVPIGPLTRPVYARLMAESPNEYLFGGPVNMYRPFRQLLTSLGMPHKARPHILRHSRASHLLQGGLSLWQVASLLGDTEATVERVYGHFCPSYLAATLGERQCGIER